MKKNTFYAAVLLLAGAVMTACSGGDDVTSDITPVSQTTAEAGVVELSGTLGSKGSVTRNIAENGTGTWEVGDKFAVYYQTANGNASTVATVNSVNDNGSANFTATLHSPKSGNNDVTLVYPASAHDGQGGFKTDALMKQEGTLDYINAKGLDIETATTIMNVEGMNATLTENVNMQPQVCLYTLYLKDNYSNFISATKLEISDGTHNYTITPSNATTVLTIALVPIEHADFTFTATTTKEGKLYSKQDVTLASCTAANVGDVIFADGNIYKVSNGTGVIYSVSFKDRTLVSGRFSYNYLNLSTITPVAMIAYVGEPGSVDDSSTDSQNGYHGLALAMHNVTSGTRWCVNNNNPSTPCSNQSSSDISVARTWINGINRTTHLIEHPDGHNHQAAKKARNYDVQPPLGTSEWFLPSLGQWQLILQGLITKGENLPEPYSTPIGTDMSNPDMGSNSFSSIFTNAGADGFWCCMSSSEYSDEEVWWLVIAEDYGYAFSQNKYNYDTVRPVIAF